MKDFAYVARYLYSVLRWRLAVWFMLIVLASALEGLTLGLFLPIIAGADSDAPLQHLFTTAFDRLGIEYTVPLALVAMVALYTLRDCASSVAGDLCRQGDCRPDGRDKGQDI